MDSVYYRYVRMCLHVEGYVSTDRIENMFPSMYKRPNFLISIVETIRKEGQRINTKNTVSKFFKRHTTIYYTMVKSKFKINVVGMSNYRIGDDGSLYKLGYKDSRGHYRGTRKMKIDRNNNCYQIDGGRISDNEIQDNLTKDRSQKILVRSTK